MDLLVERIRSTHTNSLTHDRLPRKTVLGATFAKSKKPASLFQGYHQRTKHVGSNFTLIPHRGRGITKDMVRHCSGLEVTETGDNSNNVLRMLKNGTTHEDLAAMVSSELYLSTLDLMRHSVGWHIYSHSVLLCQVGFSRPYRTPPQITLNMFLRKRHLLLWTPLSFACPRLLDRRAKNRSSHSHLRHSLLPLQSSPVL